MCGIAGFLTSSTERDLSEILEPMCVALKHRGPDDAGSETVALPCGIRIGLTQTRLAILDLSPAGHQPMTDPTTGSWIVFNGEVYNHQDLRRTLQHVAFCSSGDTETVLQSWIHEGASSIESFRGMFAFALYDGRRRQFWLVRDRLGIKPLYVARVDEQTWIFASELRALLASGLLERRLDPQAVDSYLTFGAVPAPWTLLKGVVSVLPAERWRFDLTAPRETLLPERQRYWRIPFTDHQPSTISRADAIAKVRSVLCEAVTYRMVSDVPVGVFLSGGIDSSSVVATLTAQGYSLRTFSVVFGERDFDESTHSQRIAQEFGTIHSELHLQPDQVLRDFEEALSAYDQPSIDGVNTYFISRATRQAGVKVALSGIGGDELFAGYPYFRLLSRLESGWTRGLARLAQFGLQLVAPQSTRAVKLGAILAEDRSRVERYSLCRQVLKRGRCRALFASADRGALLPLPTELRQMLEQQASNLDAVNAHSLLELSLYMANMLLRDMDQMSMAHALELREPLLDHVLVETVASLPGRMKIDRGQANSNKALLVEAVPKPLPRGVTQRVKMGFVFPWECWLRNEQKDFCASLLLDAAAVQGAGLNKKAVAQLWSDYLAHRPGLRYTDVLSLLHLVYWARRHRLTLASPDVGMNGSQYDLTTVKPVSSS